MGKVTQTQIDKWKEENHNDVTRFKVNDKECYLKFPDREVMSYATKVSTQDPMKFNEIILDNCWLGGDEEIKTTPRLFTLMCGLLAEHITAGEASLEKL